MAKCEVCGTELRKLRATETDRNGERWAVYDMGCCNGACPKKGKAVLHKEIKIER